eukprot:g8105.t1
MVPGRGSEDQVCDCECGAPAEAAAAIHAAAAGRRPQNQQQADQSGHGAPHFAVAGGGQAMIHPAAAAAMYQRASPFPGQPEMHFQPQFTAATAMTQYAAYGGGLPAELHVPDPYRSAQHHLPYRNPMELPRGSYLMPASPHGVPAGAYLAAPGPHGLSYYRQLTPGMMHMAAGGSGDPTAGSNVGAAGTGGGGTGGIPPEEAPPPSASSAAPGDGVAGLLAISGSNGSSSTGGGGEGGGPQPKESILESLLAARSERLSAASMEAEDASTSATGGRGYRTTSVATTGASVAGNQETSPSPPLDPAAPHHQQDNDARGKKGRAKGRTGSVDEQLATSAGGGAADVQIGDGGGVCTAAATARGAATASANVSAAVAMHLTGLPAGFPHGVGGGIHHGIGTMQGVRVGVGGIPGIRGMPPPTAVAVSPGGGPMQQYMGPAVGALPAPPPSTQQASVPPQQQQPHQQSSQQQQHLAAGFASHDAFEEHMRQQEKKLQKRAANRKSAQLSRKRKKALIEELRYENQDLQRHEDILEVIPDPVFAFDTTSGRVWFASTSASAHFGLSVQDLTSACFFDLMTEDCSKRLRVLIDTAAKDVTETNSALLHERMTVRFKKRRGAILLGELSGRLSFLNGVTTAVCSVRPLSLATDEIVGKGYFGDASVGELADDTSADQSSSGEDSRSAGTGQTTGSNGDGTSSGTGTGCTSIADEASSSGGVPSLSSLEVKRRDGSTATSSSSSSGGRGGRGSGSTNSSGGSANSTGNSTGSTGSGGGSGSGGSEEGLGEYNSEEADGEGSTDSDVATALSKEKRRMAESESSPPSATAATAASAAAAATTRRKQQLSRPRSVAFGTCVGEAEAEPEAEAGGDKKSSKPSSGRSTLRRTVACDANDGEDNRSPTAEPQIGSGGASGDDRDHNGEKAEAALEVVEWEAAAGLLERKQDHERASNGAASAGDSGSGLSSSKGRKGSANGSKARVR